MLSKIKLCFATGVLSLVGLVMSYGVCDLSLKKVEEAHDAFMEAYEPEIVCCLKVMIDHYREHGITEENKQKLFAVVEKIEEFEGGHDEMAFTRLLTEGIVSERVEQKSSDGSVFQSTRVNLFEEDEDAVELLKNCSNEFNQRSYEAAFNRFLEIAEIAYQECHRLTHEEL